MLKFLKTAALFGLSAYTVIAPTMATAAPLSTWYGRFVWEESLGRIGGASPADGVAAFVTYTLTLGPSAGATGCMLNGEGYQTYVQLKCTATPQMESVIIKFYKFGTQPTRYYSGQPLFTMSRTEAGIMTRLQGLRPSSDASPRSGAMFRRIG